MNGNGNLFNDDAARRIQNAVRAVEGTYRDGTGRLHPIAFPPHTAAKLAITKTAGPGGEPDFDDARYWVEWSRVINSDGVPNEEEETSIGSDPPVVEPAIVAATNIAEQRDDGTGTITSTHALPPGQRVYVYRHKDKTAGDPVIRYWFNSSVAGAMPFLCVVTACSRDGFGNLTVLAKRLLGLPYSFEAGEEVQVWCGPDPMIVHDSLVLAMPILPLQDNPEIAYYGLTSITVEPSKLNMPNDNCIVQLGDTCDPGYPYADPCNDAIP